MLSVKMQSANVRKFLESHFPNAGQLLGLARDSFLGAVQSAYRWAGVFNFAQDIFSREQESHSWAKASLSRCLWVLSRLAQGVAFLSGGIGALLWAAAYLLSAAIVAACEAMIGIWHILSEGGKSLYGAWVARLDKNQTVAGSPVVDSRSSRKREMTHSSDKSNPPTSSLTQNAQEAQPTARPTVRPTAVPVPAPSELWPSSKEAFVQTGSIVSKNSYSSALDEIRGHTTGCTVKPPAIVMPRVNPVVTVKSSSTAGGTSLERRVKIGWEESGWREWLKIGPRGTATCFEHVEADDETRLVTQDEVYTQLMLFCNCGIYRWNLAWTCWHPMEHKDQRPEEQALNSVVYKLLAQKTTLGQLKYLMYLMDYEVGVFVDLPNYYELAANGGLSRKKLAIINECSDVLPSACQEKARQSDAKQP